MKFEKKTLVIIFSGALFFSSASSALDNMSETAGSEYKLIQNSVSHQISGAYNLHGLSGQLDNMKFGEIDISKAKESSPLKKVFNQHRERLSTKYGSDINENLFSNNLSTLLNSVSFYESDNNGDSVNPKTTASGAMQNTNPNKITVINRFINLAGNDEAFKPLIDELQVIKLEIENDGSRNSEGSQMFDKLNPEVQAALTLLDLLNKKGSDEAFKPLFKAGIDDSELIGAINHIYERFHHTGTINDDVKNNIKKKLDYVKKLINTAEESLPKKGARNGKTP